MAVSSPSAAALLDLPREVLTGVCEQLDFRDLIRVAETCKRLRHGDGGLETAELPTKSPVVTALREHAFPGGVGIPSARPVGGSESWATYLARCVRQRGCREAPPIAPGYEHCVFLNAAGRLQTCGKKAEVGHGDVNVVFSVPTPVAVVAGTRMRGVAAGMFYGLALGWDGRVHSWGRQPGRGDQRVMPSPALVEGLEGVRGVAASSFRGLAVTQSGAVFQWGSVSMAGADDFPEPTVIQGLGGVLVRCVRAGEYTAFAISEGGELLSWGYGEHGLLGHGNTRKQRSPKRVKALRDIPICDVTVGNGHALALAEDGVVYAWGDNKGGAVLGNPHVGRELLPKPIEAMRGVRVGSVAAANHCSYCVSNTGEVWAWGCERDESPPLSQQTDCFLPKPIESLRGIKVDAVIASTHHTLAIADDGSVYLWGNAFTARSGALGLGSSVRDAGARVPTPQRIPELRVACGL